MKHTFVAMSLALGLAESVVGAAGALFTPIDLSPVANLSFTTGNPPHVFAHGDTYPTGDLTLGGVPFAIPSTGNNIWHSDYATGDNPRYADIAVNAFGVDTVFTLIGTFWGEQEEGTFASIEFIGNDDAYYRYDLDGNVDIRDYNLNLGPGGYTTTISGLATEVWNNVPEDQHLDMQTFILPESFSDETLVSVRLTDNGDSYFQRAFIAGMTVRIIPEPTTFTLLGLGSLVLVMGRRGYTKA